MSSDEIRARYLTEIRDLLGQMIESGEVPEEADFEHFRQSVAEGAPEEDRPVIQSITWDEARADLWE